MFPFDDRVTERKNPDVAGRPSLVQGSSLRLYPGA